MAKIKLFENFKNVISKIENMPAKEVNTWKTLIIVLIIIDLIGVYWYLKLKTVGGALIIVLIIILAFLLFFSRNNATSEPRTSKEDPFNPKDSKRAEFSKPMKGGKNKMPEDTEEDEEQEEEAEPEESKSVFENMDFGLGNADDFQNRMDDALGKPLF